MSANNLRPEDIDKLGQALLTLTKELWVVKDRLRVLEAALAEAGTIAPNAVETYQPDESLTELLGQERAQLIKQVLGALNSE
jgi:hypothetical protein